MTVSSTRLLHPCSLPARLLMVAALLFSAFPLLAQDWTYRVRPGDTLWDLGSRYLKPSVPWQHLQSHNRVSDPYRLPPGSQLRFPVAWLAVQPVPARVLALRGSVPNAGGRIAPGQFVRIDVILPTEKGVIALPQTTLSTSLYGDYVYVVRPAEGAEPAEDGTTPLQVAQVFVTPGRRSGGLVEIVQGVAPGDQVVSAGQNRLSNGQPATVDNSVNPAATATGPAVTDPTASGVTP